jgi:thiosulfate/3-mercaptopyruvate sulfurtransferase
MREFSAAAECGMLKLMRPIRFALFTLVATLCLSQEASDPWPASSLLEPAALVKELQSGKAPTVLCVAFPVLYNSKHIVHAVFAGPGSKPEGLEALKKVAETLPRDADLVIYCGCCPMATKCPNIRPAYRTLKEMGFTHIRVLDIPTNMQTDWYSKDYPSEAGSAAGSTSTSPK